VQPLEAAMGRETVAISAPDATVVGVRGDAGRRDVAPAAATTLGWTAMKPQRSVPPVPWAWTMGAESTPAAATPAPERKSVRRLISAIIRILLDLFVVCFFPDRVPAQACVRLGKDLGPLQPIL
jgi:hypothetical protein